VTESPHSHLSQRVAKYQRSQRIREDRRLLDEVYREFVANLNNNNNNNDNNNII